MSVVVQYCGFLLPSQIVVSRQKHSHRFLTVLRQFHLVHTDKPVTHSLSKINSVGLIQTLTLTIFVPRP